MMTSSQWLAAEAPGLALRGLAEHTAEVQPGFGFVCVTADKSLRDSFVAQAETRGAKAVLVESADSLATRLPVFEIESLSACRGRLAAQFYGEPSQQIRCIGITGTNGKTSVAYHIADLLTRLGHKTGYMGTLGWGTLDGLQAPDLTTGNAVALQRRLARLRDLGCEAAAIEISSHALDQGRADDVEIEIALFTNLSRDHLDYHQTMEAYASAKARLFTDFNIKLAILNADQAHFTPALSAETRVIRYGREADWSWRTESVGSGRQLVSWQTPFGRFSTELGVVADFMLANVTAALALVSEFTQGIDGFSDAVKSLRSVPGRMQIVSQGEDQPQVVIDFAHTPDALEKALTAGHAFCCGQLICVVGCGGNRDRGKRPEMARVAQRFADVVWLTSDNPRWESPDAIIEEMLDGRERGERLHICVDRSVAIKTAIESAAPGDLVLIAGKGHEAYQEICGVKHPYSDESVVQEVLGGQ